MSNSKFQLTGENTNLARVAQMILGPCTNVLRDVLRKEISPSDLEKKVRAYISMKKKSLINKHQEALVYGHDYSKFDVTLLYFLLRNMCSIQPHSNKWGKNPRAGDGSVSANIERIRLLRNEYGHNSETSISDTDFIKNYQYIKDTVQELEMYLGTSTKYQDEVKELETCPMDPTQSEKNIKELLDLHEKFKDISEDVKEMKNTVLPWNIKVIYGNDVLKWKEDDRSFVETHNFHAMINKVRQQSFVMFVGVPGSGKTASVRHTALLLQEKDGYEILPTKDIKDIETYCDPRNPQVFVIDDVLGVFGFDMKELEKLTMYKDRLNEPTMPETKVLMTCREVVFKHEALSGSFLSNEKHVVQLHSKENALNDQDKYDLFAKYYLDTDLLSTDTMSKISKSFPYLCKLFSRKEELRHYGPQFFISPVPCYMELLDNMKIRNKVHYASLVLLMTNQNSLSEKDFNNESSKHFDEMKFKVLKRCKVDPVTCRFLFTDALTEMVGTYTEQRQSKFKFIHDSMLEIVAYHFGRHSPELILQYMDSDYIANYIKPDKYKCRKRKGEEEEDNLEQTVNAKEDSNTVAENKNVHDLCIKLQESQYHLLADRLFKDIHKGELFNVFENEALKHPLVLQNFLDVMKCKPYSELFTVFLSELKEEHIKQAKTSKKHFFSSKSYNLLMNSRWIGEDDFPYTCARAIDWVIFYGHNQILQFIIDQIIKHTETVNDLFQTPFNIRSDDCCTSVDNTDCIKRNESDINENSARRCDVSDDDSWSDLCSETDVMDKYFGTEDVIVEQRRLLNLSCYSGDLLTFQTLLPYYDKNVLFSESWRVPELLHDDDNDDWNIFDPPMVVASKTGHLNILLELLNLGAYANDNSYCDKSLVVACSKGYLDLVIELLKHKANVNITNSNMTPLIVACLYGYSDIVLELIKHGADVNITVFGNSPLIAACSGGNIVVVLELIKQGADVNITVSDCSPLIIACSEGHFDIVLELLKHGADANITVSDNSPLVAACSIHFFFKGKNLLRQGTGVDTGCFLDESKYDACSKVQSDMIHELLKNGADVNINIFQTSALIAACLNRYINIATVQELLKHGADVNFTVTDRSPLIAACTGGRYDVVLELLKHKADVKLTVFPYSPLIAACANKSKSIDIISELLQHGADVNSIVSDRLPLIVACAEGHLDKVLELLKYGAHVNITVSNNSPLLEACSKGHLNIVHELLKHGADANITVFDDSPLIAACSNGYFDVINELLNHGADVNITALGKSPLTASCFVQYDEIRRLYFQGKYAKIVNLRKTLDLCSKVHLDTIRVLIKHGADVNGKNCTDSPLTASCIEGHLKIVDELLKHGADINITVSDNSPLIAACSKGHLNIVNELLKFGADVNITVADSSPLIVACSKGHWNIANELLKHIADINLTALDNSPLIAACSQGHLSVVNELLKHGADINITVSGNSPLIAACSSGYSDIISRLLKHGAEVNVVSGRSPLLAACLIQYFAMQYNLSNKSAYANTISDETLFRLSCSKVHLAIIRQLLKHGADVNVRHCKDSPLNASCSQGHLKIVRELLKHGADVNTIVNDKSPLITACQEGHFDIVDELIKHGANVNIKVSNNSPLIAACSEGHLEIVYELLIHGADVHMRVSDISPLIAARSKKHLDIVSELLKHGPDDVNSIDCDNSQVLESASGLTS